MRFLDREAGADATRIAGGVAVAVATVADKPEAGRAADIGRPQPPGASGHPSTSRCRSTVYRQSKTVNVCLGYEDIVRAAVIRTPDVALFNGVGRDGLRVRAVGVTLCVVGDNASSELSSHNIRGVPTDVIAFA